MYKIRIVAKVYNFKIYVYIFMSHANYILIYFLLIGILSKHAGARAY